MQQTRTFSCIPRFFTYTVKRYYFPANFYCLPGSGFLRFLASLMQTSLYSVVSIYQALLRFCPSDTQLHQYVNFFTVKIVMNMAHYFICGFLIDAPMIGLWFNKQRRRK